jgi:hypothetical protein
MTLPGGKTMKSILFSTLPLVSLNLAPLPQSRDHAGKPIGAGPSFGGATEIDHLNSSHANDAANTDAWKEQNLAKKTGTNNS